jgi:ParB family transcriptional regulator, chromosome partitioning protein
MAKTVTASSKATRSGVQMIPVCRLVKSPRNVRKSGSSDIVAMAESIAHRGLIQNLVVSADGDSFAVEAGERRRLALARLIKAKRLPKDHAVPCRIITVEEALDTSLDENTQREAMHPADEFDAFAALVAAGKSVEDVAAARGVTPLYVRQRLRLAGVAPSLLALFRKDAIGLDVVMALTISPDHAEQERVWKSLASWERDARGVRRAFTGGDIASTDPRVRYVGLDAYKAAGGMTRGDLFAAEDGPEHLTDAVLLNTLVVEKLDKYRAKVAKEGWSWVEVEPAVLYSAPAGLRPLPEVLRAPTGAEESGLAAIADEQTALYVEQRALDEAELDEGAYDAAAEALEARQDALDARADAMRKARTLDNSALRVCAGAVVCLDSSGKVQTLRGYVRAEDMGQLRTLAGAAGGADSAESAITGDRASRTVSDGLCRSLTGERTLALRAALIDQPNVALVSVVHALVLSAFYPGGFTADAAGSCIDVDVSDRARLDVACPVATIESRAAAVLTGREAALRALLPADAHGLWGWLGTQSQSTLLELLAFCAAQGLDAVQGSESSTRTWSGRSIGASHALASSLGFDMADWWSPTADSYCGRVSKAQLGAAVTEVAGADAAKPLAAMKKGEAVKAAERALAGSRWVPPLLRPRS